jgi:hypothetical protein
MTRPADSTRPNAFPTTGGSPPTFVAGRVAQHSLSRTRSQARRDSPKGDCETITGTRSTSAQLS